MNIPFSVSYNLYILAISSDHDISLRIYRILLATAAVDAGSETGVGYAQGMDCVATGLLACIRDGEVSSELAEEECFTLFNVILHS